MQQKTLTTLGILATSWFVVVASCLAQRPASPQPTGSACNGMQCVPAPGTVVGCTRQSDCIRDRPACENGQCLNVAKGSAAAACAAVGQDDACFYRKCQGTGASATCGREAKGANEQYNDECSDDFACASPNCQTPTGSFPARKAADGSPLCGPCSASGSGCDGLAPGASCTSGGQAGFCVPQDFRGDPTTNPHSFIWCAVLDGRPSRGANGSNPAALGQCGIGCFCAADIPAVYIENQAEGDQRVPGEVDF